MIPCLVKLLTYQIKPSTQNPLDIKTPLLYYTRILGFINRNMKKFIAITLIFLLSVTVLLSGAFGYSDCAAKCAYEMAKTHQHAAMGSVGLAAPNCCSGTMKNTCEMAGTPEIKIPECSMTSHATGTPDPAGVGILSGNTETDIIRAAQSDPRFIAGQINKTPPIYLRTLSILL
jgi:hypothetical protein